MLLMYTISIDQPYFFKVSAAAFSFLFFRQDKQEARHGQINHAYIWLAAMDIIYNFTDQEYRSSTSTLILGQ